MKKLESAYNSRGTKSHVDYLRQVAFKNGLRFAPLRPLWRGPKDYFTDEPKPEGTRTKEEDLAQFTTMLASGQLTVTNMSFNFSLPVGRTVVATSWCGVAEPVNPAKGGL